MPVSPRTAVAALTVTATAFGGGVAAAWTWHRHLVLTAAPVGVGHGSAGSAVTRVLGEQLTAGRPRAFSIRGTVSDLGPGTPGRLALTVHNPNPQPIEVTSVAITVATPSAACPGSLLSFGGFTPTVVAAGGDAAVAVSVTLSTAATDVCQRTTWALAYTGTARQVPA